MRIEYSGESSREHSVTSADHGIDSGVHSLAQEVASQAVTFDLPLKHNATWQEPISGSDAAPEASFDFRAAPLARKVERLVKPDQNPGTILGIRAKRLREARKTTRDLGERLAQARKCNPGLAKPAARRLHAGIRELGRVLTQTKAGSPRFSDPVSDGQQPPGAFDIVEQSPEGAKVVARVRPRLYPATLVLAAPSHSQVRVSGLARFFPAHTIHARRSTAVVTADDCELQSVDHYHVHRVSVRSTPSCGRARQGTPRSRAC